MNPYLPVDHNLSICFDTPGGFNIVLQIATQWPALEDFEYSGSLLICPYAAPNVSMCTNATLKCAFCKCQMESHSFAFRSLRDVTRPCSLTTEAGCQLSYHLARPPESNLWRVAHPPHCQ
jgi:hypothetical protein